MALSIVKGRDGDAPGALAGNAPVWAGFYGAFDAGFAPIRDPGDLVDLFNSLFTEGLTSLTCRTWFMINLDEPLVHGPEDHGGFAAPAMGVAVMIILLV